MAKNKIQDLRNHLFEVIELLNDAETNHMTVEKAKAIANVANVIISSAKLEIDYLKVTDGIIGHYPTTGFIELNKPNPNEQTNLQPAI